ncbi:MAG: hypothetical protein AAF616_03380 [Bacteroidota bacterium]
MKSIFLHYKSKAKSKEPEHKSFEQSKKIKILFNAEEFDQELVSELTQSLVADKKEVSLMGYHPVKDVVVKKLSSYFSRRDISVFGRLKSDQLADFIQASADFLIALDTSGNINFKYVLALSEASCKIGFENQDYNHLLLMTMHLTKNKSESVRQLVTYLKKI